MIMMDRISFDKNNKRIRFDFITHPKNESCTKISFVGFQKKIQEMFTC